MSHHLEVFQQNRNNILRIVEGASLSTLNEIPSGFNNNIVWNLGHSLLSQQFLIYFFSDQPISVNAEEMMKKYGSGSLPDGKTNQEEVDELITLLKESTPKMVEDVGKGIFTTYKGYHSDYFGISVNNIEEALYFNNMHEAFHLGVMAAQKAGLS